MGLCEKITNMKKEILKITSSSAQPIGEHKMYQPLPDVGVEQVSPFILLHHHGPHHFEAYNQGLPFGPHPHRGFETLTFIFDGEIEHADSQGFKSIIKKGGVQWMTAGRGIVHSENLSPEQRENGGNMEIIQLWMNLPASKKMVPANYQGFQENEIPFVLLKDNRSKVSVISGSFQNQKGVANSITGLDVFNANLATNSRLDICFPEGRNILFYVLDGELEVNGKLVIGHQLVIFETNNSEIEIVAKNNSRFIIGSGEPIDEPMVSHGPFVMNSTTEIMQAMRDYQMGKMGVM